jgi:CRISPR-associated protein Csb2
VLIVVPPGSPLSADDIRWAFSGLEPVDPETGESLGITVTLAADESGAGMLNHYGIGSGEGHRSWRTVTPAALPDLAARRRIDPDHKLDEAKGGQERARESAKAGAAVAQALRHAGVSIRAEAIRLQREPFESNGERVEAFAKGTRFSKHRLWHVEIEFSGNVPGPLVIGDGRFLGLGLCAPMPERHPSVNCD